MKHLYPSYYGRFACLMGECRHSCCIGWEIDVDDGALARYDAETHSELMRTLQVYLANERNHVRTAAELGLHRNSLAHRIRRIEELTGIDFNNVDERFFLELSLRLSTRA